MCGGGLSGVVVNMSDCELTGHRLATEKLVCPAVSLHIKDTCHIYIFY